MTLSLSHQERDLHTRARQRFKTRFFISYEVWGAKHNAMYELFGPDALPTYSAADDIDGIWTVCTAAPAATIDDGVFIYTTDEETALAMHIALGVSG